jgi:aminopeptidase N
MRCALLIFALVLAPAAAANAKPQILPSGIAPTHYDLALTPDAAQLTFKGVVGIDLEVSKPSTAIVLNAKGLTFDSATLDGASARAIRIDTRLERAAIVFNAAPGRGSHRLTIAYHGAISKGTFGFFAMDYRAGAEQRRTLATNFEPTGARMLVPSWDEPVHKASFSITVDAPSDKMAISNMPIERTEPLAGGMSRVRFATTPKMSTYLLFLSIGDYERVHADVDGTDVGVVVKRGDLPRAAYALGEARALLKYYNDYFGVKFPLPKLDLVAAPGQITGGSMENWGAIFYSQNHVLFDPVASTEDDRHEVFLVVAHEMAHQWFGDLVTMAWWDNLWLNEGFARWMQTHAADALHPEWRTGLVAQDIYESGKRADAKRSTHPVLQPIDSAEQADQAFDNITYDKGAAVITMLEASIGPEPFREGVRRYMKAHTFANTVDSDLWGVMQAVAGKPILEIERDFTRKSGLPLIRVTETAPGTALAVSRFTEDPAARRGPLTTWHLPLASAPLNAANTKSASATQLLFRKGSLPYSHALVNAGAAAYARIAYAPKDVQAVAYQFGVLAPIDQLNLVNDALALGETGDQNASDVLSYLLNLPPSADPIVWRRALKVLETLDRAHAPGPARRAFRDFARTLISPMSQRLGTVERKGEDAAERSLRGELWRTAALFGDREALDRAKTVDASKGGSAEDQRTALAIVAQAADSTAFDALLARARATADPLARTHILSALAGVDDPALAARFTLIAIGSDAPAGTAPSLLAQAALANPDAVWAALSPHLDEPNLPIDEGQMGLVISSIASMSSDPQRIPALQAFADKHVPADARQAIVGAIAQIRLNQRIRAKAVPEVDGFVKLHAAH